MSFLLCQNTPGLGNSLSPALTYKGGGRGLDQALWEALPESYRVDLWYRIRAVLEESFENSLTTVAIFADNNGTNQ